MGSKITETTQRNRRRRRHALKTKAGSLVFDESGLKDGTSEVPTRNDSVNLTHSGGSQVKLAAGGVGVASVGDVSISAAGNAHITAKGTIQTTSEGNIRSYAQGDIVDVRGKQNSVQMQAAKKMQEGVNKIEKAKVDKIKSTKGDETLCPTCSKEYLVNRKSGFGSRLFKTIRRFTPPYFGFAVDVLQTLYNFLIAPMLDIVSGQSLLGGTCGNKGCKNGRVQSPQKKLEEGNKEAVKVAQSISDEQDEYAAKLKGGTVVDVSSGDRTIRAGLIMNDAPAYVDSNTFHNEEYLHEKDKQSGAYFAASGKGNAKRIIKTNPHHTVGNLNIEATNRLMLIAGSPGFGIETKGHGEMQFGSFTISAGEAEAVITSQNKTTIKGKNVVIDAEDRSGTEGIKLQSPHTRVAGALHVDGNISTIGSLSIDGNLSAPFLKVPSMRLQTAKSGSTKSVMNDAEWAVGAAIPLTILDKTLQVLVRDIMPGQQLDLEWLFTFSFEVFNLTRLSIVVEPIPTGFAFFPGCPPACPPMLLPIWNWKHCHTATPQSHTHDHTVPKGNYFDDREAWGNARDDASAVPTPANDKGDGSTPGPKSNGGACGGGGFGFGSPNSNASKAILARNQSFGINSSDAYGEYDFVNITPVSGNFGYDEDGNITPIDKVNLSISINCNDFNFDNTTDLEDNSTNNTGDTTKDGINNC